MYPTERFIKYLRELTTLNNKKALVALRQGIIPAKEFYAFKYIAPFCDLSNSRSLVIYKTIGALYAMHPLEAKDANLGAAFRNLCSSKEDLETMEKRILRLIASDTSEEACLILSKYFSLFKAKNVPFPFEGALKDLQFWGSRSKREIAKAFWIKEENEPQGDTNE